MGRTHRKSRRKAVRGGGETRLTTGTIFTDKLFTGQREMAGLGIYHYGARFYSPKLGRFLSPDTIVPGAANPQAYNRYSYVLNNPLKYIDPSGHSQCQTQEDCDDMGTTPMGTGNPHRGGGGNGGRDGCRNNDPDCQGDGEGKGFGVRPKIGPAVTTIGPAPQTSPDPGFSDISDYAEFMNNAIDFMRDLGVSEKLWRKGFLWTKAINPDPRFDALFGFAGQLLSDLDHQDLTVDQRIRRGIVVAGESAITGVVSDIAGGIGFLAGEAIVPSGGGLVGYPIAAVSTSLYLDAKVWSAYNDRKFDEWGLGSYP